MSEEHSSTLSAEEVLAQAISPEKKQELIDRLSKLKSTLNQVEARMAEQPQPRETAIQELDRRLEILQVIGSETRANISSVAQIQLSEKYHPAVQNMLKNLDKVNTAYTLILDGLTA